MTSSISQNIMIHWTSAPRPESRRVTSSSQEKTTEFWRANAPCIQPDGVYEHCHSPHAEDLDLSQKIALVRCLNYNLKILHQSPPASKHQLLESLRKDYRLLTSFTHFPNEQIHRYLKEKCIELLSQHINESPDQGTPTAVLEEPRTDSRSINLHISQYEGSAESPIHIPDTPFYTQPVVATRRRPGEYDACIPRHLLGGFDQSLSPLKRDRLGRFKGPDGRSQKAPPLARRNPDHSYEVFSRVSLPSSTAALRIREGSAVITHGHSRHERLPKSYTSEKLEKVIQQVTTCLERLLLEKTKCSHYEKQYDNAIQNDRKLLSRLKSLRRAQRKKAIPTNKGALDYILNKPAQPT
ncbi:MAG: hypothetical protein ACSNEK_09955 [Parachlamydiaceae bacterium]